MSHKIKQKKITFGKHIPDHYVGDWVVFDQITGFPVWASDTTVLDRYTGYGGLRVNKYQAAKSFNIDYGQVPYIVPKSTPAPFTTAPPADGEEFTPYDTVNFPGIP